MEFLTAETTNAWGVFFVGYAVGVLIGGLAILAVLERKEAK